MTVGVAIECDDGIVLASDRLAQFGRGSPVQRYQDKTHEMEFPGVDGEVVVIGAGAAPMFIDKFEERINRQNLVERRLEELGRESMDIVDFADRICESMALSLFKEYTVERSEALGSPTQPYDLSMIVAGKTNDGEAKAYFVYPKGVSEPVNKYGSIGSGAAYAELFLRYLLQEHDDSISTEKAGKLATYAIKGAGSMDPNVGGDPSVKVVNCSGDDISIEDFPDSKKPEDPLTVIEDVLAEVGDKLDQAIGDEND